MTSNTVIKSNRKGGVKTSEGKSISRFNALKHGILKESITEYEKIDFKAIYEGLVADYTPQNTIESILIEQIAIDYVKLARVNKAEAELMLSSINPHIEKSSYDTFIEETKTIRTVREGYIPSVKSETLSKLDLYSRYETTTRNRMLKTIFMLQNIVRSREPSDF